MKRVCIYPQDIHIITGKSERYCRRILADIKKSLHKEKHQPVTIKEFCDFMRIDKSEIIDLIR